MKSTFPIVVRHEGKIEEGCIIHTTFTGDGANYLITIEKIVSKGKNEKGELVLVVEGTREKCVE
ncbi:hypothetical protein CO726_24745 [Bacillus fungorum]|uniref:Uncharacterized protein n=1 Tax=Bacillus fungorum TaxID=2039284 RepID=A0A2G6Q7H7_9BACI|nr:hypothetical protein [Bacillus fungorum]PIE92778.1 hypothetical protein CO726_24745 [Bacillus fungorum]